MIAPFDAFKIYSVYENTMEMEHLLKEQMLHFRNIFKVFKTWLKFFFSFINV